MNAISQNRPPNDLKLAIDQLWQKITDLTTLINKSVSLKSAVSPSAVVTPSGSSSGVVSSVDMTALETHTAKTTTAHGGIIADTDSRLTDARTPKAHDLDGTAHNALTGAVENNFLSSNASGKPKDSGKSASSFDVAGAAAAITLSGLGGVPSTRKITSSIDLSADRNLAYSDVGAEVAGAVAAHAPLQTGVHGLAITAAKTLTVEDDTTIKAASIQLKTYTATMEKTGTVLVKNSVASGSVAAGWWRFAQSSSLPANGIFKIKYYRGTALHSMIVQVGIFDGCTAPNISILSNTLGT